MADIRRLMELGMVPGLAKEVAAQIDAAEGSAPRLVKLGMVPELAVELVSQLGGTTSARRLIELTMVPPLATEVVAQITAAQPEPEE